MAITVLNGRSIRNGTKLPFNNYEEPFGTLEDSVYIPSPTLMQAARREMVKILFFSYKHLDEILSNYFTARFPNKLLNSRLLTVALDGAPAQLAAPVRITLKHLRED